MPLFVCDPWVAWGSTVEMSPVRILIILGVPVAVVVVVHAILGNWYFGAMAGGVALVVAVKVLVNRSSAAPSFPFGTRAWEAQQNAELAVRIIHARTQEIAATPDPEKKARLMREIVFIEAQIHEAYEIMKANDRSPGKGFVGLTAYSGD